MKTKTKTLAIMIARSSSSRLKNKIFKKVRKKTIIQIIYEKLKLSKQIDKIVLSTSNRKIDDKIVNFAKKKKIKFFRGDENNVLQRIYDASSNLNSKDIIVRANCDCPLFMVDILDKDIKNFKKSNCDLLSPFYKNKIPFGFSFVMFKRRAISKLVLNVKNKFDKEHVETYCFKNPLKFKLFTNNYNELYYFPKIRLTVDTQGDLKKIRKIFNKINSIKKNYYAKNIIKTLRS